MQRWTRSAGLLAHGRDDIIPARVPVCLAQRAAAGARLASEAAPDVRALLRPALAATRVVLLHIELREERQQRLHVKKSSLESAFG